MMTRPTVFFVAMAAMNLAAGLQWDTREQVVDVHPTQVSSEAVFRFTNTGDQPLSITKVESTCGCLVPKLQKLTFSPGEAGELTVGLDLRNRYGHFRKAVMVETGDGVVTRLYMETDIPRAYSIAPIVMKWRMDSTKPIKTAKLRNLNEQPIRLLSAASSHEGLIAELITVREGFEYEVTVTRRPSAKHIRAVIRIQTEPPPGRPESKPLKLFAYVL